MFNKKITQGVIAIVVVIIIALGVLAFLQSRNDRMPDETGNRVGDSVELDKTPTLGACTIVDEEDLRAIMQKGVIEISQPERSGVISPNTTVAEQCVFAFTTPKSNQNSLSVEVFNVSADGSEADLLDASWALDVDAKLPTFFKEEVIDSVRFAYLRVINGGQVVLWTLQQPNDQQQFNLTDQRYVVYSLSERADYQVIQNAAQAQFDAEAETTQTEN